MKSEDTLSLLKALSFAANKHRFQKRKDVAGTPYINHPIDVALMLMEVGQETDADLLVAAVLHDTIEDTETSPEEIKELFGQQVLDIVLEVTDDKSLPKEERKRLQVTRASHKSEAAKKLKLADKICNITDILHHPPSGWSTERKLQYLSWAGDVLVGLKDANPLLENHMKEMLRKGEEFFRTYENTHS
jgi:guanosine-3',5'-bis(diphosphate) 3'-pyrophosphohydrolase